MTRPSVLATGSFEIRLRVLHTVLLESFREDERAAAAAELAADFVADGSLAEWPEHIRTILERLDDHSPELAESALRDARAIIDRRLETGAW